MKNMKKNAWFLRVLALVMALGLLFGALPVAALDGETTAQEETVVSETPSQESAEEPQEEPAPEKDSELTATGGDITFEDYRLVYGIGEGDSYSFNSNGKLTCTFDTDVKVSIIDTMASPWYSNYNVESGRENDNPATFKTNSGYNGNLNVPAGMYIFTLTSGGENTVILSYEKVEEDEREAPSGVTIKVDKSSYSSYDNYYYSGIKSIEISFIKPDELTEEQIKAAFDQDLTETEDYEAVDWWDKYGNLIVYKELTVDGDSVKMVLDIEGFVDERYNSEGFTDGKADGKYTLVFAYDIDSEGNPITYSRDYVIDNDSPNGTVNAGDTSGWRSENVEITYDVEDDGAGVAHVYLYKNGKYLTSSTSASGSFTVEKSGDYSVWAEDKLGNLCMLMQEIGEIKIDKESIKFVGETSYDKAAPDSDEWLNSGSVKATFHIEATESGIRSIKIKGTNKDAEKVNDGEYFVTFTEGKDITVVATTNAGKESELKITAPQFDTDIPDKDSIDHVGIASYEKSKILNLLTFGLYANRGLLLTVYAGDGGSPITKIDVDDESILKQGDLIIGDDGLSYQSFKLPAGDDADSSNYTNLKITLTDAAGNTIKKENAVALQELKTITLDAESTLDITGEELKEFINTNIAPDIPVVDITSDKSSVPGYYKNDIHIEATITEPLTGLASAKAYFGPLDKFDAANEYAPTAEATDITKNISAISTDKKTVEATLKYDVSNDSPSGAYALYIKAFNNSDNPFTKVRVFYIDKEAPVIEVTSKPETWANAEDTQIKFTVKDKPADNNAGTASVTVNGEAVTPDGDGIYTIDPEAGKDYVIKAEDNYGNDTTTVNKDVSLAYTDVLFDNQPPTISDFTYSNSGNKQWSKDVTVSFTIDDKYDGKDLSGVDISTLEVKRADGTVIAADKITKTYDDTQKLYNCSFAVDGNNTSYTVSVKDKAGIGNTSAPADTGDILRDDTEPVIEKIVFSQIENYKKFGVYSHKAILATVFVKSGHSAPVKDIMLYNGTAEVEPFDDEVIDHGDYFTRAFTIRDAKENGTAYKNLGVYAVSEADVHTNKDTEDGVIGIGAVNVYVNDAEIEHFSDFFEAVAKTSGPAITVNYQYPAENNGSMGYEHNEDGSVDTFGSFSFDIEDEIAGVDDDTVNVYFDTYDKFTLGENGIYYPKEGAKKLEGYTLTPEKDNISEKNTKTTGSYAETAVTASGQYVLCVVAKNLGGADSTGSARFDIDNTAPDISIISYSPVDDKDPTVNWVNKDVTVTFSVVDAPAGYAGGTKAVKVTGDKDGEDYEVTPGDDGIYSFTANTAQSYTIKAWDNFNIKAEAQTKMIYVDKEAPHIVVDVNDLNEYKDVWTKDEKEISFTVDDISDYTGFTNDSDKLLSGIATITVTGDNGETYDVGEVESTAGTKTYKFTANLYQNYTIDVTDIAGNPASNTDLQDIAVDCKPPYFTKVSFAPEEQTALGKVFNFLTFGLFSSEKVIMTVEAKDDAPSSKLADINVSGITAAKTFTDITGGRPDDSTIKVNFEIDPEEFSTSTQITFIVTDESGQENAATLAQLYGSDEDIVDVPEGFSFNGNDFEVVVTKEQPEITNVEYIPHEGTVMKDEDGEKWFNGELTIGFDINDPKAYIHSLDILMNGDSVRDKAVDGDGNTVPETYTAFNKPASESGNTAEPISGKRIFVDTAKIDDLNMVSKANTSQGLNVLSISAMANNGLTNSADVAFYYLDDVAPNITDFTFSGKVDEESGEKSTASEKQKIEDALAGSGYTAMTDEHFIYFFEDETKITVSATDTYKVNGKNIRCSGVKEIHFYTVGRSDVNASVEVTEYPAKVDESNYGDMTAEFTVPAGFKGSIFAYAVDQVDNKGLEYSPDNLIVENRDIHNSSSFTDIKIDTANRTGTDNNGHALFNGNVDVTFTVEDLFSGIESIEYVVSGLEDGAYTSLKTVVDIDGKNTDGWAVESGENNLAYRMTKTITLDGFGAFNSNDIEITLTAKDRSGFPLTSSEEVISIDTDKPEIEVTYDPAAGSGNTYGTDEYEYFKTSRTMYVTVYERNFDPDRFDYSGIVNNYVSGDVPALAAGDDWSTSYSTYTGKPAHKASFTFANDGDYAITLNCTDEAENAADEYIGEKFTIDNIDPTVQVSLNGTVKNGKYYNETVTATITVTEHNFAEGDTYVKYTPTTLDFDTSYDKSSSTPTLSAWSSSGDTHTATVTFSSDGKYAFTFDYTDKALRNATQFTQSEFVIDKNADNMIKFIDVENEKAYDKEIAPKVTFDDTNLDTANTSMTLISLNATDKDAESRLAHSMNPSTGPSRKETYASFPVEEINDGIYKYTATGTDLAGNTSTKEVIFSVNRFGSTFMLSDASAEWVNPGYTQNAGDLEVIEINVNEVTDQAVSVSHNSKTDDLALNTGYRLSSTGGKESWYTYNYKIPQDNFEGEGDYTVTVSSTDVFKKTTSNRTALVDEEKDIRRTCPISFIVDRTQPEVSIDGVESGKPYGDPERDVKIICIDANINAESLVITDENDDELVRDVDYTVSELAGELDIELTVSEAGKHSLSVLVSDYAKNSGDDAVENYELNASVFTLFFYNTTAVICTAVGLAAVIALAVFLVLKKRKNAAAK